MKRLILLLALLPLFITSAAEFPVLTKRVTDLTATLTPEQLGRLEETIKVFEDSSSNQLVVLVIPTLDGYPIEEYAYETASRNKVGQKGKDNGILLLIVKNDKKLRIEVGYGLEGSLTDATSSSIIRNQIVPYFKQNNYYEGILNGVQYIIKAVAGEYKGEKKKEKGKSGSLAKIIIFLVIIVLSFIFRGPRRFGGGGGMYFGGFGGGGGFGSGGGGGGFGGFSGGGGSFGGGGSSGSW